MLKEIFTEIYLVDRKVKIRHIQLKGRKNGKPIIMLPGIGGFAESYSWNMIGLKKAGLWPIAVDHIGFGRSSKPKNFAYSIQVFSEAIASLIVKRKLKNVILVGNSFGGGVAVGIWDIIPERIASLVLVSSAGFGCELSFNYRFASLPVINSIITWLTINRYIPVNNGKSAWKSIVYNYSKLPDTFVTISDNYKDDHEIREAYNFVLKNLVNLSGQPEQMVNMIHKISHKIREHKIPSLVIWGKNDPIIPIEHGEIASNHLNAKFTVFDKCGHMPYIEHASLFNKSVIEFLREEKIL